MDKINPITIGIIALLLLLLTFNFIPKSVSKPQQSLNYKESIPIDTNTSKVNVALLQKNIKRLEKNLKTLHKKTIKLHNPPFHKSHLPLFHKNPNQQSPHKSSPNQKHNAKNQNHSSPLLLMI